MGRARKTKDQGNGQKCHTDTAKRVGRVKVEERSRNKLKRDSGCNKMEQTATSCQTMPKSELDEGTPVLSPYFTGCNTARMNDQTALQNKTSERRKRSVATKNRDRKKDSSVSLKADCDRDSSDFEPTSKKHRVMKSPKPSRDKYVQSKSSNKPKTGKATHVTPSKEPTKTSKRAPHPESEDSEDSESDWEEVEDLPDDVDSQNVKSQIPDQPVEITLDGSHLLTKKKKKKKFDMEEWFRLQINKTKRESQLNTHKVHILCLVACGMRYNMLGSDATLQALGLSVVPASFLQGTRVLKWGGQTLAKFVRWFSELFVISPEVKAGATVMVTTLTARFLSRAAANELELVLLFLSVCRSLGIETRFIYSLQPMTFKAADLETKTAAVNPGDVICIDTEPEKILHKKSETNSSACPMSAGKSSGKSKSEMCAAKRKEPSNIGGSSKSSAIKPKNNQRRANNSKVKYTEADSESDNEVEQVKKPNKKQKESGVGKKKRKTSVQEEDTCYSKSSDEEFDPERVKFGSPKSQSNKPKQSTGSPGNKAEESSKKGSDYWVEVYLEGENRWICVDCIRNRLDHPEEMEPLATRQMCYVLGYNSTNRVKDLTKRYAANYMSQTRKLRADSDWWEDTMSAYKPLAGAEHDKDAKEDQQIEAQLMRKPLPTSINDFKNHPLYALKRHLLKYEALYPENSVPLGFIRGEPVYARACIQTLHSRENWLKEARLVRVAEEPYKTVKSRKRVKATYSGESHEDIMLGLYGRWQTEDYIAPPAYNGKVPRNEYGNVELFLPSMLPMGTVHLRLPGLNKVAKKLDIDCAAAMVGWEHHGGFSHPMMDGFIVCEEFKETLEAAWEQDQEIQRQKEFEKRQERVLGNWKLLIKGLLIREKMKKKFKLQALEEPKLVTDAGGSCEGQTATDADVSWPRNRQKQPQQSTSKSKSFTSEGPLFPFEIEKM